MVDQKITAFTGYNIGLVFLLRIWPIIAQKYSCESDPALQLFFETVCFEAESYEEWGEAIFWILKNHRGLKDNLDHFLSELFHIRKTAMDYEDDFHLSEEELIKITVEFCKIYNEKYGLELQLSVDYLEAMAKSRQDFREEWCIWRSAILDVLEGRKWICNKFFWNFTIHLGRFTEDNPENRQIIKKLFETPNNIVAVVDRPFYKRDVYLKTLPDGKQLWGYATKGRILDVGVELFSELVWSVEPEHENGGFFGIPVRQEIEKA